MEVSHSAGHQGMVDDPIVAIRKDEVRVVICSYSCSEYSVEYFHSFIIMSISSANI